MKTIYLMRHSIPERLNLATGQLPLSENGKKLILAKKEQFCNINRCFSSPYRRALETAKLVTDNVEIEEKLHERIIGDAKEDFWYKQYCDYDFRNEGGESLNEVKVRMKAAMDAILEKMKDDETTLVVSHATAICCYFLNDCELEGLDASTKKRRITWKQHVVLNGKINPTDYFMISYEDNEIKDMKFVGEDNETKDIGFVGKDNEMKDIGFVGEDNETKDIGFGWR